MKLFPLGEELKLDPLGSEIDENSYIPQQRTRDILFATGENITTGEAKSLFQGDNFIQRYLEEAYLTSKDPEEVINVAAQTSRKFSDFAENPEFNLSQAQTLGSERIDQIEARLGANIQRANEMIEMRRTAIQEDKSWFGYATDLVDRYILRAPIEAIESLTERTERRGRAILNAAMDLPPGPEFDRWFQEYLDEVMEEGVLKDENFFAILELGEEVNSFGYDPDQGFKKIIGALDLFAVGQTVTSIGKYGRAAAIARSTTNTGRTAAIKGPEEAAETANKVLGTTPDPETLSTIAPRSTSLDPHPVNTPDVPFINKIRDNRITEQIFNYQTSGAFGRIVDEAAVKALGSRVAASIAKRVSNRLYDVTPVVDDGFGLYTVGARFGRAKDGMPFKAMPDGTPSASLLRKARETGGEVIPIDPTDTRKGFVLEYRERLDLTDSIQVMDTNLNIAHGWVRNTIGRVFNNPLIASSTAREDQLIASLAQMSGAAQAAIKKIVEPEIKKINALNFRERQTLEAVMTQLRDGADAVLRRQYTDEEFALKYQQMHPRNELPSQRVLDAYEAALTMEQADYLLKVRNITQRMVQKGYSQSIEVNPGVFSPAKKVNITDIADDAKIMNSRAGPGNWLLKAELEDIDAQNLWRIANPVDEIEFVLAPSNVRLIDPVDVMGYNPGGSRTNPIANFFITIGGEGRSRVKALMTTFSEKQARTAVDQIRAIQKAVRDGASDIDDIIRRNNDWNPDIQDFEDFRRFSADEGWDLSRGNIGIKGRNDTIIDGEVGNSDVYSGMRASDYIDNDLRRNDRVLTDFGGGKAYNEDPISSIVAQFQESSFALANEAYTRNAVVGWVKAAKANGRSGWFDHLGSVNPNDYELLFRNAQITGNDAFANRMREMRQITVNRLNMKDDTARSFEAYGQKMREFIFDTTGKPFDKFNPVNKLLNIGFQSAFGFFAVAQLAMQGWQVVNIMAIAPKFGLKGAAHNGVVRGLLQEADPAARKLGIERLAKSAEMSVKEAEEWLWYIQTSGRAVVDGDAIVKGTGVGIGINRYGGQVLSSDLTKAAMFNIQKYGGKALDKGLVLFNYGERMSRVTAINTAIFEFKAANPGVSILSDTARTWITRREQNLTFNMDTASRARFQQGVMAVPTQWLSYSFRAMEQVFVGRDLSKAERARLAAALMPMFGLTGFGMQSFADNVADSINERAGKQIVDPASPWYIGLKHGLIDGVGAWAGVEVATAERMAPIGAFTDLYRKVTEDNLIGAVGGPSGEISYSLGEALFGALGNLYHGRDVMLTESVLKVLRQPSGIDAQAKAIGILNNGIYRSKNGVVHPAEMGITEAIISATGFTPLAVNEFYGTRSKMFNDNKALGRLRREINRDTELVFRLVGGDNKDKERAIQLLDEIHSKIALSGFSERDMLSLRRSAATQMESQMQQMIDWTLRTDRQTEMEAMRKWQFGLDN
jgi:hypothetical protein